MTIEARGVRPLHDTTAVLVEINRQGRDLCPRDVDPREWAAATLEELAEAAELIAGAVHRVSGRHNAAMTRSAHALAAIIRAHRSLASAYPARVPATIPR